MSKYDPLAPLLAGQNVRRVVLAFGELETVLGFTLPDSARTYPQWWENHPGHSQAKAWLDSGFHTEDVNLANETVAFVG
jgi:hypothetical protein